MRKLVFILLLFNPLLLIDQKNNLKIENHWINLTKQNGKYVLYYPCDADIKQILINFEKKEMTMNYGQEDDVFKILNTMSFSNKEWDFYILYTDFGKPQKTIVKMKFIDSKKRIAEWSFTLSDGSGTVLKNDYIMVPIQMEVNYQKVKEPDSDYWPVEANDKTKKNNQ